MEPSVIRFWKGGKFHQTRTVFTTIEQINKWYKNNRNRVDGISIVLTVQQAKEKPLYE